LPCCSPEDLPNPGIEPGSPALQADSLPSELPGKSNINVNAMYIAVAWQIQILLFGGNFLEFFSPNIFEPQLVESVDGHSLYGKYFTVIIQGTGVFIDVWGRGSGTNPLRMRREDCSHFLPLC